MPCVHCVCLCVCRHLDDIYLFYLSRSQFFAAASVTAAAAAVFPSASKLFWISSFCFLSSMKRAKTVRKWRAKDKTLSIVCFHLLCVCVYCASWLWVNIQWANSILFATKKKFQHFWDVLHAYIYRAFIGTSRTTFISLTADFKFLYWFFSYHQPHPIHRGLSSTRQWLLPQQQRQLSDCHFIFLAWFPSLMDNLVTP